MARGKQLDLLGQRFGRLTVIALLPERKNKYRRWLCRCDCGNEVKAQSCRLVRGYPRSCGCLRLEQQRDRARKRPYEALFHSITKNTTHLDNTLTYEQFLEFIDSGICHYCGDAVSWEPHVGVEHGFRYSLDRKDSTKGYSKDNCVVCCWHCNRMKHTHSYEAFLERVSRIASRILNGSICLSR